MGAEIRATPDTVRSDPAIEGLAVCDTEWRLDVDRYADFLTAVTGISLTGGLSTADCYRIGNRLQAFVEDHTRRSEWNQSLVGEHRDVDSLAEILWLARFFRACHDSHDPGDTVLPPRTGG